jgi:hypothetical protein
MKPNEKFVPDWSWEGIASKKDLEPEPIPEEFRTPKEAPIPEGKPVVIQVLSSFFDLIEAVAGLFAFLEPVIALLGLVALIALLIGATILLHGPASWLLLIVILIVLGFLYR